jgi:hypothetical protein
MKDKLFSLSLRLPLALFLFLAVRTGLSDVNVFDLPERHVRHIQLMALMDSSHKAGDFLAMETVCRKGLQLETSDALWAYNLACALALQGKVQDALDALDRAIRLGFTDTEHLRLDPDLHSLRNTDDFKQRLARLETPAKKDATPPLALTAMQPDKQMTITQAATNTEWNFQLGLFHAFASLPSEKAATAYSGLEAETIRAWQKQGTAAGCDGLIYANRDNNTQPIDISRFPGLMRLGYSQEMTDRRLQIGLPNTLFVDEKGSRLIPVIGHSSMGYLNSPYWRSQPRALCGDPRQLALQAVFLLGNQLFFYPAYSDYDLVAGDLFPANTPYCFAVAGSNNAEQPFMEAALAALAALHPITRAELTRTGLLMPTLQMLFRASQRTVKNREDYLSGIAHPPAFRAANLDTDRLVKMAHALTTNDLPPIVVLHVRRETQMIPDRDFFDFVRTENMFDSPVSVARIFRGTPRTRTLEIETRCKRADARLHWVVLQGDATKVRFSPCSTNSNLMTLTVSYHEPFTTPIGNGKSIKTSRVDIGVIAETAAGFSLPSTISFTFLGNEQRLYSADGKILSMDYTRRLDGYIDPLLSYTRNWKDCYQYDAHGNMTGWKRIRGLTEEGFTAFGHKIVATDAIGRATRAHIVRYLPRRIKTDESAETVPDLAQMDDNREIAYHYQSDSDFVGTPALSAIKQEMAPPASAYAP